MWVGRYREDAIAEDNIRMRRQRSVVLGSVRELGVRDARRLLSQKLAAINQGTHKPELMMTFERFVAERWEPNILPMLGYSTARNYRHMVPSLVNARDKTTLPPEQVRALLGELKEPYRTMVLLAVLSGLRRGEIFGLRWKYVDFEEGSVIVAESSDEGHASAPKSIPPGQIRLARASRHYKRSWAHGFATHAIGLHTSDAGSAEAAGV